MNSVIANYQHLSSLTGMMREAAMQEEWDQLIELEQQCSHHVESMKKLDLAPLDEQARQIKVALINKILADDAAIREHTQPWMAKLQRMIQSSRSEHRLQQAYGSSF